MPTAPRKPSATFLEIQKQAERQQAAQEVCKALAGMYRHGSDYKDGTHAQIVRRAFEKWEKLTPC